MQNRNNNNKIESIIGPNGHKLTLDDLPPADTTRWIMQRKAEIVAAVRGGLLSLDDALSRYGLSPEEYGSWEALIDRHGIRGLRTTRLGQYRNGNDSGPAIPPPDGD